MRDNGENKKAISTFILKISRKLRDCNLSGLAKRKVTCVTLGYFFFFVSVLGLISWER